MASCGSSEPFHNIVFADGSDTFNRVTDIMRSSLGDGIYQGGYYITFDDEQRTASLTISNLKVSDADEGITLTFDNVPWNYSESNHQKQRVISADELIGEDPQYGTIRLTDVEIIYSESNDLDFYTSNGLCASYIINSRYQVVAYPYHVFAEGTTRVSTGSGNTAYEYSPIYYITLDPEQRIASIDIKGLTDDKIRIDNLELEFTDYGYILKSDDATTMRSSEYTLNLLYGESHIHDRLELRMQLKDGNDNQVYVDAFLSPNLSEVN